MLSALFIKNNHNFKKNQISVGRAIFSLVLHWDFVVICMCQYTIAPTLLNGTHINLVIADEYICKVQFQMYCRLQWTVKNRHCTVCAAGACFEILQRGFAGIFWEFPPLKKNPRR